MTKDILKTSSKYLSLILRHQPDSIGLTMNAQGWVAIDELISKANIDLDSALIAEIVATSDKQRFALSDDGLKIRANQGHSVQVDLQLIRKTPPEILFHGTAKRSTEAIRRMGLKKGNRQHVHLSTDAETAQKVGQRHGQPVVLRILSAKMDTAGHSFFQSQNGVWLCEHVPPEFLE